MRVLSLVTEKLASRPGFAFQDFSPRLCAFTGDSDTELGGLAELVSHLLIGRAGASRQEVPPIGGELLVGVQNETFRLRRSSPSNGSRLTISRADTNRTEPPREGVFAWHGGAPADVLGRVFCDPRDDDRALEGLLSSSVAAAFNHLSHTTDSASNARPSIDRDLLRRRDELAQRIETTLGARREESQLLESRLIESEEAEAELATRTEELRRRLGAAEAEIEAEESRARYAHLTRIAHEAEGRQAADDWEPRVGDLDDQIAHWRATLAQLDTRLARVRGELAQIHPDDVAPELALADQRASVAVTQRLLADLESEVARFARSGDSPLCVCQDAHPRLNPLVETLGRHVHRLAGLIEQQDLAMRGQELLDEAERIERSQAELRCQLEKLLERRQTLWRTSRARAEKPALETPVSIDRTGLEQRRAALAHELENAEQELERLHMNRDGLLQRRSDVLNQEDLRTWRLELETLQGRLGEWRQTSATTAPASLRASDLLAKLSDGELTQLRLVAGGRAVTVRDRHGNEVDQRALSTGDRRLVVWALRIALADACIEAGVVLPLVLEDPFRNLDDRHTANLVTALDDLQRRGRQVLLFTRRAAAIDRIRSLGGSLHTIGETRPASIPQPQPASKVLEEVTTTVVEQLSLLDLSDPIDRFPIRFADRDEHFSRARIRTVGDLLEADPSVVAEAMQLDGVTAELVSLWQTHLCLVCFVPGLTFAEAKLLSEIGILSVEDLAESDSEQLVGLLRKHREGGSYADRARAWIERSREGNTRWQRTSTYKSWQRNRSERRSRIRENTNRRSDGGLRVRSAERSSRKNQKDSSERSRRRSSRSSHSSQGHSEQKTTLRFYLEIDSPVVDAPSIGNKRASELQELGVRTVMQLLDADPEVIATGLNNSRIDASLIVAWQHQAGLVCRVPGLRGHDAQVLVGCGFTTPDEIASMKPGELFEFVDPFCETPEGQRALRGSKRPDLAEIQEWIEGARHCRVLGAA